MFRTDCGEILHLPGYDQILLRVTFIIRIDAGGLLYWSSAIALCIDA